jgi:hypothetical protein
VSPAVWRLVEWQAEAPGRAITIAHRPHRPSRSANEPDRPLEHFVSVEEWESGEVMARYGQGYATEPETAAAKALADLHGRVRP